MLINLFRFIMPMVVGLASVGGADRLPLSDGGTLDGWVSDGSDSWRVEESAIVGSNPKGASPPSGLATVAEYEDFHLKLEYRLDSGANPAKGSIRFRYQSGESDAATASGYSVTLDNNGNTGSLTSLGPNSQLLRAVDVSVVRRIERTGDWNEIEVVASDRRIMVFINAQKVGTYVDSDAGVSRSGKIVLVAGEHPDSSIAFRNISIEALDASSIPPESVILSRFGTAQSQQARAPFDSSKFLLSSDDVVVFAGQENFVREQTTGELESLLAARFADTKPRFRSMAWEADTVYEQWRDLNFGDWEAQLRAAGATVIIAQYGQMEALDGLERLTEFKAAYHRLLDQFARQTNRLVLVSPMLFEKPFASHAPNLTMRNGDVRAYAKAVESIAESYGALFVDLTQLRDRSRRTTNGIHLTDSGLRIVAHEIARQLGVQGNPESLAAVREAIVVKNRLWFDCWRPANWSFVYGDRVNQMYGKGSGREPSLRGAFEEQLPLVEAADTIVYEVVAGGSFRRVSRKEMEHSEGTQLSPEEEEATFELADGYEVNLFASEEDGVVNPVQFAWDAKGRLWVACSPSYPQTLAGALPRDYILILEDSDRDGRADRSWRFADGLSMVQGVEPSGQGAYVCDFDGLLYLEDTDGDGRADERSVVFSGFGVGDTHQLINSVSHGSDGSLWFSQGLHAMSKVETPHGIARLDRSGLWRYRPRRLKLEGFFGGGMAGANCWGVAFDDFGQVFHKSGDRPQGYWSVPGLVANADPSGSGSQTEASASYRNSPEQYHSVGPLFDTSPKTTSLAIIGTQALPDDIQGCALIGGYFGSVVELHRFHDEGSGFRTTQLPKLMTSTTNAFRPVDVSVGPDGAMYLADWYNPIIGHYQASYADPRRDKSLGRIWRITATGYPRIDYPDLSAMSLPDLISQVASPERWIRYQAKRLLFEAPTEDVIPALDQAIEDLEDLEYGRELIGVYQAHETVHLALLDQLLNASDFRIRAYGARVLGEWSSKIDGALELLDRLARDEHPRVRLEATVAASYIPKPEAIEVVSSALDQSMDPFLAYAVRQSARSLQAYWESPFREGSLALKSGSSQSYLETLLEEGSSIASPGEALYNQACLACHQPDGKGLPGVYPPLLGSQWVEGDADRLVKIVLHGLTGPIDVAGQRYGAGTQSIPMPAMGGMSDDDIAVILTWIRDEFGNGASGVEASQVRAIRQAHSERKEPWTAEALAHDVAAD